MKESVIESMFRMYYESLCLYAYRYIGNRDTVEDIVQNFFVILWEKEHLSVSEENFLPYAYRSIHNSCINYFKSEIVKEDFLKRFVAEQEQEDTTPDSHKEELYLAIEKLSPKARKVFMLKFLTGLKYKEIAEITGISINTVKYHICESLSFLRESMKDVELTLLGVLAVLSFC